MRLGVPCTCRIGFYKPIKKLNIKTFSSLYKSSKLSKTYITKEIKTDRSLIQRILNAINSGRSIDMGNMLENELSQISMAFAQENG